jgi:hypothetical protein
LQVPTVPSKENTSRPVSAASVVEVADSEYLQSDEEYIQSALQGVNPYRQPYQDFLESLFSAGSSRLFQILAASVVGATFGVSSVLKSIENASTGWIAAGLFGGAAIGAGAGLLLVYREIVRVRFAAGGRVPLLARLYFGRPAIAILTWTVSAFTSTRAALNDGVPESARAVGLG